MKLVYVLPKVNRLARKKDFDLVYKKGESFKSGFLLFKVIKNPSAGRGQLKESRFGFVVSRKISTKATVRNKVRRRLREAVFTTFKGFKKPADVVIITLPGIDKKEFSDITQAVSESFKKLKLI